MRQDWVGQDHHPFLLAHPLLVNTVYPNNVSFLLLCLEQFLIVEEDT